jgi:NitT/TauT family transport system permease protein
MMATSGISAVTDNQSRETALDRVRQRRRRRKSRRLSWVYPAATVVIAILLWQGIVDLFNIQSYLLPGPIDVVKSGWDYRTDLLKNLNTTLIESVLGFVLSVVIGVPLAVAMTLWRPFDRAIFPLLVVSQTVPKVAVAPIFIIWVGIGLGPRVVLAFFCAFFPIVIDTALGLRSPSPELLSMVKVMGASTKEQYLKVRFPHALPSIFSGFKVAITLAVIGAIVSEIVGGNTGLGALLLVAQGNFEIPLMFADVLVLSILGLILFYLVELAEALALRGRR